MKRSTPPPTPLSRRATAPTSPEAAWSAVYGFVTRCRVWAVEELERRAQNGKPAAEWESYLRFTDHTLRELENGTLDAWFTDGPLAPTAGRTRPAPAKRSRRAT